MIPYCRAGTGSKKGVQNFLWGLPLHPLGGGGRGIQRHAHPESFQKCKRLWFLPFQYVKFRCKFGPMTWQRWGFVTSWWVYMYILGWYCINISACTIALMVRCLVTKGTVLRVLHGVPHILGWLRNTVLTINTPGVFLILVLGKSWPKQQPLLLIPVGFPDLGALKVKWPNVTKSSDQENNLNCQFRWGFPLPRGLLFIK